MKDSNLKVDISIFALDIGNMENSVLLLVIAYRILRMVHQEDSECVNSAY